MDPWRIRLLAAELDRAADEVGAKATSLRLFDQRARQWRGPNAARTRGEVRSLELELRRTRIALAAAAAAERLRAMREEAAAEQAAALAAPAVEIGRVVR